jgi:hypothetical protein
MTDQFQTSTEQLIHIYNAPPQTGDEALCGHVKTDEESYRLHRSDNQCQVCEAIAEAEGRTLVSRPAWDPESWVEE